MSSFDPISISSGPLTVEILPQGLTFHRILIKSGDDEQLTHDLVCGPEDPTGHVSEGRKFLTQVVGRYANRLGGNRMVVQGQHGDIHLDLEQNESGTAYLHGGSNGYDFRSFEPISPSHDIVTSMYPNLNSLTASSSSHFFHLNSPHQDQGFPNAIDVVVRVEVTNTLQNPNHQPLNALGTVVGSITCQIKAKLVDSPKSTNVGGVGTPINLTLHAGYRLTEHVKDSRLFIKSSKVVEVGKNLLPTGNFLPIKSTPLDVGQGDILTGQEIPTLGSIMSSDGIDRCYILDHTSPNDPLVLLQNEHSNLTLLFYSNQSAVQCYTANGFGDGTRKALHGNVQTPYPKQGAVFLEFHAPISSVVHPSLRVPKENDTILYPGQVYDNWFTMYIYER